MNLKIVDNCLETSEFRKIQKTLFSNEFPWYYLDHKIGNNIEHLGDPKYDQQFSHNFYDNCLPRSSFLTLLDPLLLYLNALAIVRIKANLTVATEKPIKFAFHTDLEDFDGETAIFYFNTNNGKTIFIDGTEIDSIENRLVTFDARYPHTGTTCTDQKIRCVLNLNYYKRKK